MKLKLKDQVIDGWYQTQENYPKPAHPVIQELFKEAKRDFKNRKVKRPIMLFKIKKGRHTYTQRYSITTLERFVLYPPQEQKDYLIELVGGNVFGL